MGFLDGKIPGLILGGALLLGGASLPAADEIGDIGENMKGAGLRMPYYDRDQLEFIITSQDIQKTGNLIEAVRPVIDMIRPDADIDSIVYMDQIEPYALTAAADAVVDFWRNRPFSDALFSAEKAEIDQPSQTAAGSDRVFLRSPIMDLNGIGFLIDYPHRTALVRSNVEMVIRHEVRDTKDLLAKAALVGAANLATLYVTADSLLIDMVKNEIQLEGNVVLREARINHLRCDRMVIKLDDLAADGLGGTPVAEAAEAKAEESRLDKLAAADGSAAVRGVKEILGIGNVEIDRAVPPSEQADSPQRINAAQMSYDLQSGLFIFSGDTPTIQRGSDTISGQRIELSQQDWKASVFDDCRLVTRLPGDGVPQSRPTVITSQSMDMDYRNNIAHITGDVRIDDIRLDLACDSMAIRLADSGNAGGTIPSGAGADSLLPAGSKEVVELACDGNVIIRRKEDGKLTDQAVEAGKAIYTVKDGRIVLSNGVPRLIRGKDSISGREMVILLPEERLQIDQEARIVLNNWRNSAVVQPTTIESETADLNFGANHLSFAGSVEITDSAATLNCSGMEIYLADDAEAEVVPETRTQFDPLGGGAAGAGKVLSRITCVGNVELSEARAKLETGELVVTFREKSNPTDASPTGRTEVDKIFCDNGVKITAKEFADALLTPDAAPSSDPLANPLQALSGMGSQRSGTLTAQSGELDLAGNRAVFTGGVHVTDTDGTNLTSQTLVLEGSDMSATMPTMAGDMPVQIALTAGKELNRIIATDDVIIDNVDKENGRQRATGQRAVYEVFDRSIVLTEQAPKKASIIRFNEGRKILGGRIEYDLNTGDANITEGLVMLPYDGKEPSGK